MQSQYYNDTDAQVHIFALSTKWLTNSLVGFHMYIAYSFKCPFHQFCHLGFQNANRILIRPAAVIMMCGMMICYGMVIARPIVPQPRLPTYQPTTKYLTELLFLPISHDFPP